MGCKPLLHGHMNLNLASMQNFLKKPKNFNDDDSEVDIINDSDDDKESADEVEDIDIIGCVGNIPHINY